jgi:hypothetical protein
MASVSYLIRPGLPELPLRIARLPIDERGYPVPWFVAMVGGKPDFRVADGDKIVTAVRFKRCWICGQPLGRYLAFVVGPMCTVNRISSEPPSHTECATFAVKACPFLALPKATRRDANLPEAIEDPPGVFITRNPAVTAVWITNNYVPRPVDGGVLFSMGVPTTVLWFTKGRRATHEEALASFDSSLPALREIADAEGESEALQRHIDAALPLLP